MYRLDKFLPGRSRGTGDRTQLPSTTEDAVTQVPMSPVNANIEAGTIGPDDITANKTDDAVPTRDAQNGVRKMEAVTLAWTRKSLATALILCVLFSAL
jgi:hypothetical protein